jgi:hypothetical protein
MWAGDGSDVCTGPLSRLAEVAADGQVGDDRSAAVAERSVKGFLDDGGSRML